MDVEKDEQQKVSRMQFKQEVVNSIQDQSPEYRLIKWKGGWKLSPSSSRAGATTRINDVQQLHTDVFHPLNWLNFLHVYKRVDA